MGSKVAGNLSSILCRGTPALVTNLRVTAELPIRIARSGGKLELPSRIHLVKRYCCRFVTMRSWRSRPLDGGCCPLEIQVMLVYIFIDGLVQASCSGLQLLYMISNIYTTFEHHEMPPARDV